MAALSWRRNSVCGRAAHYGEGGSGPSVLFLHGWGLAGRSYGAALEAVVGAGMHVFAPALPGFGGTAELPPEEFTLAGYARWVAAFVESVEISGPIVLVGHSFGGGVAIRVASDVPDLVAPLILVNSIGGSSWTARHGVPRAIHERPLWDWSLHLHADLLLPIQHLTRVLPVIVRDGVPNLLTNPATIWQAGRLARTADLSLELAELNRRRVPVVTVWSAQDGVIPEITQASLRAALGDPQAITVPGKHNWLISDPRRFGDVIATAVGRAPVGADGGGTAA